MVADGQVTVGTSVMKPNVHKLRRINEKVIGGFAGAMWLGTFSMSVQKCCAGSTADAFTLMDNLEIKIEEHPGTRYSRLLCESAVFQL